MLPSDAPIFQDSNPLPVTDGTSGGIKDLLQGALQVFQKWLEHLPAHDPQRKNLNATKILVKDILDSGDYSEIDSRTTVRALLCTNCRRLDAAPEECSGRPLDRCPLVRGQVHEIGCKSVTVCAARQQYRPSVC